MASKVFQRIFMVCMIMQIIKFDRISSSSSSQPPRAIQIIVPENHTFHLNTDALHAIFDDPNLKHRQLVVVSIAGPHRYGKSFLMNFFIRYLEAQYNKHDISDWLDVNANQAIKGFQWRFGQKPETNGFWMWSEIFTHDFPNGEQIAIVLLDTQGIFDSDSSVKDCTAIFALSMLASSVQCYNLMHKIHESDLQHLDLFAEYGRLAIDHTHESPFQSLLLFLIRDWPYADETNGYGWTGDQVVDSILAENERQSSEMHELRTRIKSNFNEIRGFLLPYPGAKVARSNQFTGNLKDIDAEFLEYVKQLAHDLLAPENLRSKKVGGQALRGRDFVAYLNTFVKVFNGDSLPEPKSWITATAEVNKMILFNDCLQQYVDIMEIMTKNSDHCYAEHDLLQLHEKMKRKSMAKANPKLRGSDAADVEQRLADAIEEHFRSIRQQNKMKRAHFERMKEERKWHRPQSIEKVDNSYSLGALAMDVGRNILAGLKSLLMPYLRKIFFFF